MGGEGRKETNSGTSRDSEPPGGELFFNTIHLRDLFINTIYFFFLFCAKYNLKMVSLNIRYLALTDGKIFFKMVLYSNFKPLVQIVLVIFISLSFRRSTRIQIPDPLVENLCINQLN